MRKRLSAARRILAVTALIALTGLQGTLPAQGPARPQKQPNLTAVQRKIDNLIRTKAAEMAAAGVNRSNAANSNASQRFSNPSIKVDNRAMIHVYLELTEVNAARLAALRAA